MKKLLITGVILCSVLGSTYAQSRAIGGRIGYGLEASYQHGFGSSNMLQVDLGLPGFHGLEAVATYNWVFPIHGWTSTGSWNWYAGVGAGIGFSWPGTTTGFVGVAGQIGLEYNFKFPLQLSVDYRPLIGPYFNQYHVGFNDGGLYAGAIGIGVRYAF